MIDMTNAPDKSKIPNATFSYTLHAVPQSPTAEFVGSNTTPKLAATDAVTGVGTTYKSTSIGTYEVRPGLFPNGAQKLPVSKVTFRSIDFTGASSRIISITIVPSRPLILLSTTPGERFALPTTCIRSSCVSRPLPSARHMRLQQAHMRVGTKI